MLVLRAMIDSECLLDPLAKVQARPSGCDAVASASLSLSGLAPAGRDRLPGPGRLKMRAWQAHRAAHPPCQTAPGPQAPPPGARPAGRSAASLAGPGSVLPGRAVTPASGCPEAGGTLRLPDSRTLRLSGAEPPPPRTPPPTPDLPVLPLPGSEFKQVTEFQVAARAGPAGTRRDRDRGLNFKLKLKF